MSACSIHSVDSFVYFVNNALYVIGSADNIFIILSVAIIVS